MSLRCPRCSDPISPWKVRRTFLCAHCGVSLKANVFQCGLIVACIWTLLDFLATSFAIRFGGDSQFLFLLLYVGPTLVLLAAVSYAVFSRATVTLVEYSDSRA